MKTQQKKISCRYFLPWICVFGKCFLRTYALSGSCLIKSSFRLAITTSCYRPRRLKIVRLFQFQETSNRQLGQTTCETAWVDRRPKGTVFGENVRTVQTERSDNRRLDWFKCQAWSAKKDLIIGAYQNGARDFIEVNYPDKLYEYNLQPDTWCILDISIIVFAIDISTQHDITF